MLMNGNHNPAEAERKGQAGEMHEETTGRRASQRLRKSYLRQQQLATEAEEEAEALLELASGAVSKSQGQKRASKTPVKTAELHARRAAQKIKWKQRQLVNETPEEAAERRAAAADRQKRYRLRKRAGMTPEEAAAWRAAETVRSRLWQQRKLASFTPEEAAKWSAVQTARNRRWRQRKRASMTPEEAAEWRAAVAVRRRRWNQRRLARMTPEEIAERRSARNACNRRWRERKFAGVGMTPEEAATWRAAQITRHRHWQQRKLARLTPEEAAEYRAAQTARKRRWIERKRADVTREESAKYRAAEASGKGQWWQRQRAAETVLVAEAQRIPDAKAVRHSLLQQGAKVTPQVTVQQHSSEAEGMTLSSEQRRTTTFCLTKMSNHCDILENRSLAYENKVPAPRDEPVPVNAELFCCPGCESVFSLAESLSHHLKYRTMLVTVPCETCRCQRYFFNKCLAYAHVQQHFPNADVPKLESIVMRGSVAKCGSLPLSIAQELLQLEETIENLVKSCCYRQVKEAAANEHRRPLYESGKHDCDNLASDG